MAMGSDLETDLGYHSYLADSRKATGLVMGSDSGTHPVGSHTGLGSETDSGFGSETASSHRRS